MVRSLQLVEVRPYAEEEEEEAQRSAQLSSADSTDR